MASQLMTRALFNFSILLIMLPSIALGQHTSSDENYFFSDLGDYFTAPTHWNSDDWMTLGLIAGGTIVVAETLDDRWKDEMTTNSHPYYHKKIDQVGDAWGDLRLSGPFILGVYGYGRWKQDDQYIYASHNMVQSVVYTGAMTLVLKSVFHRDRPNETSDESGWFKNGSSFPSGHVSTAFAVSRSYLNSLENPSVATQALFYGLATSTGLARTYDNKHWASDVIAGALLGIYTADFVCDRNKKHRTNIAYSPYVGADSAGLQVNW
ncbi:MAG: phosphatase PAP2 family protein [Gammaproteobacteria bacterium]|nr:phosphatase PAP2 family protein [Gammaproteobacteria bacterium]